MLFFLEVRGQIVSYGTVRGQMYDVDRDASDIEAILLFNSDKLVSYIELALDSATSMFNIYL